MSISGERAFDARTVDLMPPVITDYYDVRNGLRDLADEPGAWLYRADNQTTIQFWRVCQDDDPNLSPLVVSITGRILSFPTVRSEQINIRYQELSTHTNTRLAALVHSYRIEQQHGIVIDSEQSIESGVGGLEIFPQHDQATTRQEAAESERGAEILQETFGKSRALTSGDCGVLYERMLSLVR